MKRFFKLLLTILKWLFIVLFACVLLFFIVRFVGQRINDKIPPKGINEEMYVDINGTQQWISIYGEDINNPVLLYLHGGPGSATSAYDYAFTRKWADIYTVVTWDQRNCGKSYSKEQDNIELTYNLMMSDGLEMTKFILEYMGTEKIVLLGHSWGSVFGANLALEYPEYYSCFVGTGQFINMYNNEVAFKEEAKKWVGDNAEGIELVNKLTIDNYTGDYYYARNALMEQYGYGLFADGQDYNMAAAQIFNPYYSLMDFVSWIQSGNSPVYLNFLNSNEFTRFYLDGRSTYQIPYYNINGDRDYQCNYIIAQEYFDTVKAPYKKMYIMKDTTHGLLESKSEQFSEILHEIAEIEGMRGE